MSSKEAQPQLPRHVAIIMDGNGRWATAKGLIRTEGHRRGADAAQRAIDAAKEMGIPYVTLFGFSSENWNRPAAEIDDLMDLLRYYLKKETAEMHKAGVRVRVIGDRKKLAPDIVSLVENIEKITKENKEINVTIALSYGGRQDIVHAAKALMRIAKEGDLAPEVLDEQTFSRFLMTAELPDVDLMIRTGGEYRISNFLLWSSAYAELYFTDTLWPDFDASDVKRAVDFFCARDRRYGGLSKERKA